MKNIISLFCIVSLFSFSYGNQINEKNLVGEWKVTEFKGKSNKYSQRFINGGKSKALVTSFTFKEDKTFTTNSQRFSSRLRRRGRYEFNAETKILKLIFSPENRNIIDEYKILSLDNNNIKWENKLGTHTIFSFTLKKVIMPKKVKPKRTKEDDWKLVKGVDKSGKIIKGNHTISAVFEGIMTNSSATDAYLKVNVLIFKNQGKFASMFTFYEHGRQKGMIPSSENFEIKIEKEDGNTEYLKHVARNNHVGDLEGFLIQRVLAQDTPLKINVDLSRVSRYAQTIYDFEIDPKGLKELLEKL